jgi:hypothetical protein
VFDQAARFDNQDSGTREAPIVCRPSSKGEVRFTAGRPVENWNEVVDPKVLKRLAESARGHVLVTDLRAQGMTDFGKLTAHGFAMGSQAAEAELFYDDAPMMLARWPNDGFRGIEGKDDSGKPIELRLKDATAAKSVGFEPIPLEKMGVYEDPRRASWPVAHQVDSISLPHD